MKWILLPIALAYVVVAWHIWRAHRRVHPALRGYERWLRGLPPAARFQLSQRLLQRHYRQQRRARMHASARRWKSQPLVTVHARGFTHPPTGNN